MESNNDDKAMATGDEVQYSANAKRNIFKEKEGEEIASKADKVLAKMEDTKEEQLIQKGEADEDLEDIDEKSNLNQSDNNQESIAPLPMVPKALPGKGAGMGIRPPA